MHWGIQGLGSAETSKPASAGAFVPLEQLREWRGTIAQLQSVQNGCQLPSYEEAFRLANMEAANALRSLDAAIRDARLNG